MNTETLVNKVNAIIFYETVWSGKRAKEFCDRFESQLSPKCELTLSLWSFSSLELPGNLKAAARDAGQATLIIVGLNGDNALPRTVKECLDSCDKNMRVGNIMHHSRPKPKSSNA